MKIVYIEVSPGNGGSEEYALNLAREATSEGNQIIFVLGSETGAMVDRIRDEHFKFIVLPMKSSFNPFAVINSTLKLKKFIEVEKPDIIHVQMLREQSLVIGAKILGAKTKLIRTFHRLDQFNWKMKPFMPIYRKYTNAYIAISEYVKGYLAENGLKRNVYVIQNGVAEVIPKTKKKGLGYLGRITTEKGIKKFIIKNIKLLTKTSLTIGGEGPDKEYISKLAVEKSLKIILLGQITDKAKFFSEFNVFVLPSEIEALPLVVLEAFSAGTPVVTFDIPSLRNLINEKNGILVKTGDYKKLFNTAKTLSEVKDYKVYSESARETYLHEYTITKMWYGTQRLYDRIKAND